jgi:hypothetical protein
MRIFFESNEIIINRNNNIINIIIINANNIFVANLGKRKIKKITKADGFELSIEDFYNFLGRQTYTIEKFYLKKLYINDRNISKYCIKFKYVCQLNHIIQRMEPVLDNLSKEIKSCRFISNDREKKISKAYEFTLLDEDEKEQDECFKYINETIKEGEYIEKPNTIHQLIAEAVVEQKYSIEQLIKPIIEKSNFADIAAAQKEEKH